VGVEPGALAEAMRAHQHERQRRRQQTLLQRKKMLQQPQRC
jgi:hypothetical protein